VFPLYTPSGLTVVREFAFDHPFHNGVFVGQNPVRVGDRIGNFWALPVPRSHDDQICFNIGRMDPQGAPTVSPERTGPWFIRDYGMAMFNATQEDSIYIAQAESWTAGLRVVAYDGAIEPKRVDAWREA
jgi:hypothetical protein